MQSTKTVALKCISNLSKIIRHGNTEASTVKLHSPVPFSFFSLKHFSQMTDNKGERGICPTV